MTLNEFIEKYNNKYVEVAGSSNATNQCVDLANAYLREVLVQPIVEWTNAQDFPSKLTDNFDFTNNTPSGIPDPGDIVVWKSADKVGHIAVFVSGDASRFTSFDQNYPLNTPCHLQEHNYTNVLGWLRLKGGAMTCEIKDSTGKTRTMDWLLREWEVEKARAEKLDKEVASFEDKVNELSDENNTLRNQLDATDKRWKEIELQLRSQVEDLAHRVGLLEKDKTALREALTASQGNLDTLMLELADLEESNDVLRLELENGVSSLSTRRLIGELFKRLLFRRG